MTAVASSAFAAFAVFALVGVLILAFGQSATTEQDRQAQDTVAEPLAANPEPAVVTRPEPAAEPTDGDRAQDPAPTADPTPDPTSDPTSDRAPDPTPDPTPEAAETDETDGTADAPGSVEVVVLNQTTRKGLAAVFQDVLEHGGWEVKRIGDFRGNVPVTTVYYPPGFKAEAEALAAEFDQVDRIRPAFPGAAKKRLTVILCKDYPKT